MSQDNSNKSQLGRGDLVQFGERLISSAAFNDLFDQGMALVEQAASYLDGEGRAASKTLEREVSLVYASESMRLTTRLMQMASWLLVQRAVNEGEMTLEQAQDEQRKVSLTSVSTERGTETWDLLPIQLRDMVERSISLQEQIIHFDKALNTEIDLEQKNASPISSHINLLEQAFQR